MKSAFCIFFIALCSILNAENSCCTGSYIDDRAIPSARSDEARLSSRVKRGPQGTVEIFYASGTALTASAIGNMNTFTGRYFDEETGLYYFRARYFDPETNGFISRDPLGYVDGYSLYVGYFVNGMALDPSGTHKGAHSPVGMATNFTVDHKKCTVTLNLKVNLDLRNVRRNKAITRHHITAALNKHFGKDSGVQLLAEEDDCPCDSYTPEVNIKWVNYRSANVLYFELLHTPLKKHTYWLPGKAPAADGMVYPIKVEGLTNKDALPFKAQAMGNSSIQMYDWVMYDKTPTVPAVKREAAAHRTIAHEFGHLLGFNHPNYDSARAKGLDKNDLHEYTNPYTSDGKWSDTLMGKESDKLMPFYFKNWKEAIDSSECSCHISIPKERRSQDKK